ncbi:MAG: hypothetical protein WDA22_07485 [Bacteroidota bacterium]
MIDPKQFYTDNDLPDEKSKQGMWDSISKSSWPTTNSYRFDRRSFIYGIAASFIIMFSSIGIYSVFKMLMETTQPQEIRMDRAYQSAIREFEAVVHSTATPSSSTTNNDLASLRVMRLQYLNQAIEQLRQETNSHDLSPLKRQRLHELYNMKLTLLQEMLQQGDIVL